MQFDVVFVSGDWYRRVIGRNGMPLAGQEAEEEQRNWEQVISGLRQMLPGPTHKTMYSLRLQGRQRFRTQASPLPVPFEDLPRLFDLKLVGVEEVRGRLAHVIEATPRPGADPGDEWEDAELHDRVRIWIDVAEQVPLRLDFDVLADRPLLAKGSSFNMEWIKINDQVWMPAHQLLRLTKVFAQCEMTASDFRKFDVKAWIVNDVPSPASSVEPGTVASAGLDSTDKAAIRSMVQKGFQAYQRGDLAGLLSFFSERSPNLLRARIEVENKPAYYGQDVIRDLQVDSIEVANDSATARVSFDAYGSEPGVSKGRRFYTFQLVREDSSWRLWGGQSDETEFARELLATESETERDGLLAANAKFVTEALAEHLVGQGNELINFGNYTEAVASFQMANKIAERIGSRRAIWKALYGLGHGSLIQGNEQQAEDYFRRSLVLCQEAGNQSDLGSALYQIGEDYAVLGDYREAMQYYQRNVAIGAQAGKERLASTLEAIGDVFVQQGNDEQALEHYQQSLTLFEQLEANVDIKLKVTNSLGKIGDVLTHQGSYKQALEYYQRHLALSQEMDATISSAFILQRIGDNYALQGLLQQSLASYQKSLDLFQEEQHKPGLADTLGRIANVYIRDKEYDRAAGSARQALEIAEGLSDPPELARIQTTLGNAQLGAQRYDAAQSAFTAAIANIERMRSHVAGTEQDRELFFEGRVEPYHAMVELLIQQGNVAQALSFAEMAKARVLSDALSQGRERVAKEMTAEEAGKEQSLNQAVVAFNRQLAGERVKPHPSQAVLHSLEAQAKRARLAYEAFELAMYAEHPELKVQRGESRLASLDEIGGLLTDDSTAFLEYVVTKDRSYLFVVTRRGARAGESDREVSVQVYPIEIGRGELTRLTASFRTTLAENSLDFREKAHKLYDLLLKPAAEAFDARKTLCIVPSGPLWELPFQALLSGRNRYVVDDHAVFYVPSLSVLYQIRNKADADKPEGRRLGESGGAGNDDGSHVLLAVANPALTNAAGSLTRRDETDASFAPLPEQEQLARSLAQIYGSQNSKLLIGYAARKEAVETEAGGYEILHFAAHAILDNDDPLYSGLLLSPQTGSDNSLLEAREIMQLDLHAKLAVLSGCETARGRVHEGEGIMGMAWALFVAGTPTTVVSQWKMDSAATARLMTAFHGTIARGLAHSPEAEGEAPLHRRLKSRSPGSEFRINKAEALRRATLKLMADPKYRHPFYWAAFVMIGDGF